MWGAKYSMIKRYLVHEEAVRRTPMSGMKTSHLVPSWQQINVMRSVEATL